MLELVNFIFQYTGYASCPLITGKNKCIMAEFNWDGQPMETFPVNQGKERRSMYSLKADVMPSLYWQYLIRYRVILCFYNALRDPSSTYNRLSRFSEDTGAVRALRESCCIWEWSTDCLSITPNTLNLRILFRLGRLTH